MGGGIDTLVLDSVQYAGTSVADDVQVLVCLHAKAFKHGVGTSVGNGAGAFVDGGVGIFVGDGIGSSFGDGVGMLAS